MNVLFDRCVCGKEDGNKIFKPKFGAICYSLYFS